MCTTASGHNFHIAKDLTCKPYNVCFDTGLHTDAVLLFAACALATSTIQCCLLSCIQRYISKQVVINTKESRIEAPVSDLKGHLKYKKHGIGKHINQAGNDNDADKFVMMG